MGAASSTPGVPPKIPIPPPSGFLDNKLHDKRLTQLTTTSDSNEVRRIVLIGGKGAGKSQLTNTIMTAALKSEEVVTAVASHALDDHVTTSLHNILLPETNVYLCDMPGYTDRTKLQHVLDGYSQQGHDTQTDIKLDEEQAFTNKAPTHADKPHGVIYCIAANDLANQSNIRRLIEAHKMVLRARLPFVVALTKCDVVDFSLTIDPPLEKIYASAKVQDAMLALTEASGFLPRCIFPVISYHHSNNISNTINTLALNVLWGCVQDVKPAQIPEHKEE